MGDPPHTSWTMARFLDEEFGPPMLLRAARLVVEARQITEGLGTAGDSTQARARLRELIGLIGEQAQLHHWTEEDDIAAELADLSIRDDAGVDLLRPLRAGLLVLETMLHSRLITAVTQNWRQQGQSPSA